jgi:hypothetical protein
MQERTIKCAESQRGDPGKRCTRLGTICDYAGVRHTHQQLVAWREGVNRGVREAQIKNVLHSPSEIAQTHMRILRMALVLLG